MSPKQKLILLFIHSGFANSQYDLVKQLDKNDFRAELEKNLEPLLEAQLISVCEFAFNSSPFKYSITGKGKELVSETSFKQDVITHIKALNNAGFLLKLIH